MFATRLLSAAGLLPILSACFLATATAQSTPSAAYPQPNPSADEQFMLERINIARANPPAEGRMLAAITDATILQYYSYYDVSTAKLISDFAGYSAQPPLAMNAELCASAPPGIHRHGYPRLPEPHRLGRLVLHRPHQRHRLPVGRGRRKHLRLLGERLLRPRGLQRRLGRTLTGSPREHHEQRQHLSRSTARSVFPV